MSKVTPPGPAGAERLTVKVKLVVPAFPSLRETSLIVRLTAGTALGVSEKSSTDRPSSAPVASKLFQRIQTVAPLAMPRLLIVLLIAVRLAAALPSRVPATAAVLIGLMKSSGSTSVQVPVVRLVALVLYWKSMRSSRAATVLPMRHCSPLYEMARLVSVEPVL